MSYHPLRVARIVQEAPDARPFVLAVPPELAGRFRYRAGQFRTFRVPHPKGTVVRCNSLSSARETNGKAKDTVRRAAAARTGSTTR